MSPPDPLFRQHVDAPSFNEQWEAQAYCLVCHLHDEGLISWREWADTLAGVIKEADERNPSNDGSEYYLHWLHALERLIVRKNLAEEAELVVRKQDWKSAYASTPHGDPVIFRKS